jgi:hypothetical protein
MNLHDMKPGDRLEGFIPHESVQIISSQPYGDDAVELVYRKKDGSLGQQIIYAADSDKSGLNWQTAPDFNCSFTDDDWDDYDDAPEEEINELEEAFLIDEIRGKNQNILKQGTVFIDDTDSSKDDRLLFYIEDILEDGRKDSLGRPVKASHRMHFIEIYKDGTVQSAGLAPYLDYTVPQTEELSLLKKLLEVNAWWGANAENLVRDYAVRNLMPSHLNEVRDRRTEYGDKVEEEVKKRLRAEILYWDTQAGIFSDKIAEGKTNAKLNADRCRERVNNLESRLKNRLDELTLEKNSISKPPMVLGGTWIVPRSMLQQAGLKPDDRDAESRKEIEQIGMDTVMAREKEMGYNPIDVSKLNIGYDIESKAPDGTLRFIEVKGRQTGKTDVTVIHNEMRIAANSPDKCILAVVIVDDNKRRVTYFAVWVDAGPVFAETSRCLDLAKLRNAARVDLEKEIVV